MKKLIGALCLSLSVTASFFAGVIVCTFVLLKHNCINNDQLDAEVRKLKVAHAKKGERITKKQLGYDLK